MSTHSAHPPIASWQAGDTVDGYALVTRRELRQDRNDQDYLDLELADASGSMAAKVWPDSPALEAEFGAHDYVAFRGRVKSYKGQLQLSVDTCRAVDERDRERGFDEDRLIPTTRESIDDLWRRLSAIYPAAIEHPALARLAEEALKRHGDALRVHPAAKIIHHAYRGGLLEHVVSMAELAVAVADHYPQVDRGLLLVGVLFHDLGKLRELGALPRNEYTVEGRLVGHTVIGRDLLLALMPRIPDFPGDLRLELEHLVLSHSGRREYGAAVEPLTPEALALHAIDDLDAKLNQVEKAREAGDGFQWVKGLGRRVWLGEDDGGGD